MFRLVLAVLAGLVVNVTLADPIYSIQATYLGDQCGGTPYAVTVIPDENCTVTTCESFDYFYGSRDVNANMMTNDCSSDYLQVMRDKFGNSPYLLQLLHIDDKCTEFSMGFGYPAMGACVGAYNESDGLYAVASLFTNGSASLALFLERTCFANQQYMATYVSKEELSMHSCTIDWFKWFSSSDAKVSNGSGSASPEENNHSSGDTIVIALSAGAFSLVLVVIIVMRRRQTKSRSLSKQTHFAESERYDDKADMFSFGVVMSELDVHTMPNYSIESFYPYVADCSGASNVLKVRRNDTCAKNTCSTDASNNAVRTVCDPVFLKRMKQIFGSAEHIIQVMFDDSDCSSFSYAIGYRVDDECLPGYFESESLNQNFSYNATLFDNGSAQIDYFTRGDVLRGTPPTCSSKWGNFELARDEATTKTIQDTACVAVDVNSAMHSGANYCQWYTSYTYDSGLSTGAIVGLACGCVVVAVLIVVLHAACVAATTYGVYSYYAGTGCEGTPYAVYAYEDAECLDTECAAYDGSASGTTIEKMTVDCTTDYVSATRDKFSSTKYIIEVGFNEESCSTLYYAYGVPALGNCEGSFKENDSFYIIGSLNSNGSAAIKYYNDSQCATTETGVDSASKETLATHSCDANWVKWYTSNDDDASSSGSATQEDSSGLSTGAIIGIICDVDVELKGKLEASGRLLCRRVT
ncbi:hypothetical protein PRNP1_014758 [Phytophthora ramorum]